MKADTWVVRTAGDRWRLPARDGYDPGLLVSYSLYLILLQLNETNSILNEGELNTFVMGDSAI